MKSPMFRKRIVIALVIILIIPLILSWVSTNFESFQGFGSFLGVTILGIGILWAGWRVLRNEEVPCWVGWLMVGTMILRLIAGITWFIVLPQWGHGTEGELAGYVMSDAHRRDTTAWELSQSDKPLFSAFQDYRMADQYGGLLFLSATIYRYLGGEAHQPLMMVVLTASFSALSILFVWVFVRRLWGKDTAKAAAWILFAYPEGILLGSSPMREAFMMSFTGMAIFGLLLYWQDHKWQGIGLVVGVLLVCMPISSLFAIMLLGILIAMILILDQGRIFRNWILWVVLGGLLAIGFAGIWFFGERIYPEGASNPVELIRQWLIFAAKWEARIAVDSSGWFKKILESSPEWTHVWLVLGYGTVRPFLPAALIADGKWLWKIIAIWRAVGWTVLLTMMLYAPVRAVQKIRKEYIAFGTAIVVWFSILVSAYRGGGDQWDNPRYRAAFVILQVSLAGWVWVKQRQSPDPWFRRVLVGLGLVFAWFVPWYLRRYTFFFTWNVINLFKTVGLGVVSAVLYWVWDLTRGKKKINMDESDG